MPLGRRSAFSNMIVEDDIWPSTQKNSVGLTCYKNEKDGTPYPVGKKLREYVLLGLPVMVHSVGEDHWKEGAFIEGPDSEGIREIHELRLDIAPDVSLGEGFILGRDKQELVEKLSLYLEKTADVIKSLRQEVEAKKLETDPAAQERITRMKEWMSVQLSDF